MKLFGIEFGSRSKAQGVTISVPVSPGIGYYLGSIAESFAGAWSKHIVAESRENLLRFSAVYACISRIANDVSILRPMLMAPGDGDTMKEVTDSRSPYLPLMQRPNAYMNWIQFLAYWLVCKLIYGNAYAIKDRDARGVVVALYPVDPRLVKPMVAPDGEVYYSFSGDQLSRIPAGLAMLEASEVIHDRMNTLWHPLVGVGPIYACASSTTQGIRIQANSARFFENMSRPSGHLSHPGNVTPEQLKLLKAQFEEGFSGGNIGRLLVTGGDAKYTAMAVPAEQSQLIEQLKWTVEDVARCFHVPLHKLQAGSMPTFTNIGALNQQYYDEALKVHIEAFELLMTQEVVMKSDYCVELDLSGLLRMDPKTRAETAEIELRSGSLSPNEARARENRGPVEGGDSPMVQQQNFSLAALAKRDAQEDPFGTAKPEPAPAATPAKDPEEPDDPEEDSAAAEEEMRALLDTITKGLHLDETV